MAARISLHSNLNGQIGAHQWHLESLDTQTVQLRIDSLQLFSVLPVPPWKTFRWMKSLNGAIDQRINVRVGAHQWLSWRQGQLSIQNYLLTIQFVAYSLRWFFRRS